MRAVAGAIVMLNGTIIYGYGVAGHGLEPLMIFGFVIFVVGAMMTVKGWYESNPKQ